MISMSTNLLSQIFYRCNICNYVFTCDLFSLCELEKQFFFFSSNAHSMCEEQFIANASGKQKRMLWGTVAIQRLGI